MQEKSFQFYTRTVFHMFLLLIEKETRCSRKLIIIIEE